MTPEMVRIFASYNTWMNVRLYEACNQLSEFQLQADCGAYFKSVLGTLNHLYVGDTIWLSRFTQKLSPYTQLNELVYPNLPVLRSARTQLDTQIEAWSCVINATDLQTMLHYTSVTNSQPKSLPLSVAVAHFFNHQTHHRGQVTTLLSQRGIDVGATDLAWMPMFDI